MSRVIVVTGTDTGVGKTIATAALAVRAGSGGPVTMVKPVQTGIDPNSPDEASPENPADVDVVHRLTGCATQEHVRLPAPLAPDTAARLAGVRLPSVAEHADRIRALAASGQTAIVEGAGGLLVRLDGEGGTIGDLAVALSAEVYVVTRAGLGTLNHTELTVAALRASGVEPAGLVIGAWPEQPGLAERCNVDDLPRGCGVPVVAVVPEHAAALSREGFTAAVPGWFIAPPRPA